MASTASVLHVCPITSPGSQLEVVIQPWLATLDSEQTRAAYRRAVVVAFKTMKRTELDRVTPDDVASFKSSQQDKAASTVALRLAALRSFYGYAVAAGHAKTDPTKPVKSPKVNPTAPRALSLAQARKIVAQIDTSDPTGKRDACAVALLFSGLRVSEVVGLNVGDVRLEEQGGNQFARVHIAHGKGNKARDVDLPVRAFELVQAYLAARPGPREDGLPLFVGNVTGYRVEPGRLTADGLYRQFRRYARRAGVRISGSHAARHTWALAAEQNGAKVADIAAHLGHANLAVTTVYLKRLVGARNPASDAVPVLG